MDIRRVLPKIFFIMEYDNPELLSIQIEQVQNWQNFEMPIDLLVYTDLDTISIRVNNHNSDQEYQLSINNGVVQRIELDPENWILKEVQYLGLNSSLPDNFNIIMYHRHPNPFNLKVNVNFFIRINLEKFNLRIFIYNLNGSLVEELNPMQSYPGMNKISWNANNRASGTYFFSIEALNKIHTQKIQLVK